MRQRPQYILLSGAVALYWLVGLVLAAQLRGLQYDEALLVQGGVHLLNEWTELPLPHDPDTWLCARGRCLPLMTVRYVGAVKEYLGWPLFVLFGTSAFVVRLLSVLLASMAVYGVGRLVGHLCSPRAGAVAAFALAVHPAFVDQSVFDNGTVAAPFFALGLLLVALARYGEAASWQRAFAIGLAAGFGVWARANFTWVLFALVCALHVDLWRWAWLRRRDALALAGGMLAGSLPFWIYQVISRGGTFAVFGLFGAEGTWAQRLLSRAVMFAESLVSDREHRAIWGGGAVPAWQAWLFALILVASVAWCARYQRRIAMATLVLYAFHFSSTVQVAEHHFVTAIPFAIACVVATGWRWFLPVFVGIALYWNGMAIAGVRATGGVGQWSDGIVRVMRALEQQHLGRGLNVVDWGLQNNLFVLSHGRFRSREWLGGADAAPDLAVGGLYLVGGDHNTFFESSREFTRRLAGTRHLCEDVRERSGALYARLCDVEPTPARDGLAEASGLHPPEKEGWRWSKREFAIQVRREAGFDAFALEIYVPPAVVEKLGPVTLKAAGRYAATYTAPGAYRYVRQLPEAGDTIRFALDKAFLAGEIDGRELGVIVKGLTLRRDR